MATSASMPAASPEAVDKRELTSYPSGSVSLLTSSTPAPPLDERLRQYPADAPDIDLPSIDPAAAAAAVARGISSEFLVDIRHPLAGASHHQHQFFLHPGSPWNGTDDAAAGESALRWATATVGPGEGGAGAEEEIWTTAVLFRVVTISVLMALTVVGNLSLICVIGSQVKLVK